MNERIERLIENATRPTGLEGIGGSYRAVDPEELVKLVVSECMMICGAIQNAGELYNQHEFADGAAKCKLVIARDFGLAK